MVFQLLGKNLEKAVLNGKKLEEVWFEGKKVRPMGWQPGPNTLIYYPFKNDSIDKTGNSRISGGIKEGLGYRFTAPGGDGTIKMQCNPNISNTIFTQIARVKITNTGLVGSGRSQLMCMPNGNLLYCWYVQYGQSYSAQLYTQNREYLYKSVPFPTNQRVCIAFTISQTQANVYINSVEYRVADNRGYHNEGSFWLLRNGVSGIFSEYIAENRQRTAQEILDYYNQTKSNYGL